MFTDDLEAKVAGLDVRAADYETILAEIRRLMGADTATILLMERSGQMLEPIATSGLDRTLRAARRIPLGRGFAGTVAATRQPYEITDVSPNNVLNPVLLNHHVHSLLGVPLLANHTVLGVLHVGVLQRHTFSPTERELLQRFAAKLAGEIQLRRSAEERSAARALQHSLLPSSPSSVGELALATRYIPAEGDLGGDWYDVFELPDDRLGIVMGDVIGHGLQAAVVMGRLRSALRAYALEHESPAEVLTRLDAELSHFEYGALATVLFGVAAPPYEVWTFASAGHMNPVVAVPGQRAREYELATDPLLGFRPGTVRRETQLTLPPGGSICLFTDGLIERRPATRPAHEDDLQANLERLMNAFVPEDDPEISCSRILATVIGDLVAEDDIAMLVAHRNA